MRIALRTFSRAYWLAALALAIGVGISTALFSLVDAVVLRPLPFPEQDNLYIIWKADPVNGFDYDELAYPELLDIRENVDAVESVALMPTTLYGYDQALQIDGAEPTRIEMARVTPQYFATLGVSPLLGRDFTDADHRAGAEPVAILSHWAWREYFDADRDVIGRQFRLSEVGHTVIGVMAEGVDLPRGAALWTPIFASADRRGGYLQAIARVKPGVSREELTTQLDALLARLAQDHGRPPYSPTQQSAVTPLPDYWLSGARPQLLLSLGGSLLLLAAACVTAVNLFSSRLLARTQEIAVRVSLGASPASIARRLAAECVMVASVASLAGIALARGLIALLASSAPASIPRADEAALNPYAIAFAVAAAASSVLCSAAAPIWMASRSSVEGLLRESGGRSSASRGRIRLQGLMTAAQAAIAVVLLAGSTLLITSVRRLLAQDVGFAREAVTMNLTQRGLGADTDLFFTRLLENLRRTAGVSAAGAVLMRPLQGSIGWDAVYSIASDGASPDQEFPTANFEVITPGYFDALGTPLLRGRDFDERDTRDAPPVVIINRSLADRLERLGVEPLGALLQVRAIRPRPREVVGIVADARYRGVRQRIDDVYFPYLQSRIPVRHLVIRGSLPPADLAELVRQETLRLDSAQPPAQVETIAQAIRRDTAAARFNMALVVTFGLGALLLAAAGVYSVVSETVAGRRREIAIRGALGADRLTLTRGLTSAALKFVLAGELAGLALLGAAAPWLSGQLYQVQPGDPIVLGGVTFFLLAVAVCAAALPASAASRQDAATALQ